MLLQPVARGSRRCSEKKKWEDASRDEINTAKQIGFASKPASRSRDTTTSIDASHKLSIDAGRQARSDCALDDCGCLRLKKVGSKLPRHAVHRKSSMLSRSVVMNQFFVLTSCFHAEPSNLHVHRMPGFLRMLVLVLHRGSVLHHGSARWHPRTRTPIFSSS